jgi:hypothetical protein
MKKLILLFAFAMIVSFASAQVRYIYCEIVGTGNLLGTKVTIVVDYGEQHKFLQQTQILTDEGKAQKFNSMIDALNYMGDQGWEFVQAYAVTSGQNSHVYHYLLKMEIKEEQK